VKKSERILFEFEAQMIRENGMPIRVDKCADKMLPKFPVGMPKKFFDGDQ
jgi:hypothetical protein